nr:serine hydrolase domain-containing protein [uncultured Caldimonas sp.]
MTSSDALGRRAVLRAACGTVLAAALALGGCAGAPERPAELARGDYSAVRRHMTEQVRHEMRRHDVVGLSIALVDDQRVVWAEGFGHADKEKGIPATADTLYRVGSISKLFTVTAAMQLAEQGKLDIDAPVTRALPQFSIRTRHADAPPITLRQLMTHHAGLPRDEAKGMWAARTGPFTDVVDALKERDLAYAPGTLWSYSNVGMTLLGHAVQNAAGVPFAEHLRASLLEPLAMRDSSFEPGLSDSPQMARGYRDGKRFDEPQLRDLPAGGLNASVRDMSRFVAMVLAQGKVGNRRLLQPQTVAQMLAPQNADVALDTGFHVGLGWMLSTLGSSTLQGAGTVAHHGGATVVFRAQTYLLPQHKLGVVVLSNSSNAQGVVDRIANETLALALEAKTGIRQPKVDRPVPAEANWPTQELDALVGDYVTVAGHVRVQRQGQRLKADVFGRRFELVSREDRQLGLRYAWLGLVPIDLGELGAVGLSRQHIGGRELLVAQIGGQKLVAGQRIEPSVDMGRWRERLGTYEIENLGDDHAFIERIRLVQERGHLLVELTSDEAPKEVRRQPLKVLSDDEALLLDRLADAGETVRVVGQGDAERIEYAGYRLRRVAR